MMIAFKVKALICQGKINHFKRHLLLATTNHRCRHTKSNSYKLLSYRPPDWASQLQMIPLVKVKLFQPFTPIHKWSLPNIPDDVDIYIKRDDMTGSVLSGNKVRKLEFLLGEALATGCQAVITCVGVQSNHCRTTAVAAKQLSQVQGVTDRFDDVILTVGSGGTAAGVAIGNFLTGSHLRVHAFAVCDTAEYFHSHINETLNSIGLGDTVRSHDIINIHEGARGLGYGISKPEELEFIKTVAQQTSILLDHTYTGKSALALTNELRKHRSKIKGSRILFLHSG
ncbi:putative D-cysteine desulfhydrase 1, mitochondrial [Anneissia japonica]|uniref:putative D-cysteine desulfhydrase 1, mitochondrial n=1 Tax=Anneissia japonica TaxID=1529436 RepID=UPI0014258E33|nr:putative D-cysteine desulfhydrase 1, mitochondrial [Anneissia japonica]